jgi:hypothetical protein
MKYIFLMLLYTFWAASAVAQTAKEDLQHLMDAHLASKAYNFQMKYSFFGEGQSKPIETMDASNQLLGDLKYFKLGDLEVISDNQYIITVNHDEKYIICDLIEKYDDTKNGMGFQEILANIQENGQELKLEINQGASASLKIFKEDTTTPAWVMQYDRNTFHISAIIIYFDEEETEDLYGDEFKSSWMEIKINYLPPTEPSLKTNSILAKNGKSFTPKPKYKSYEIYDQTAQK